jgi:hypothetical protein
MIVQGEPCPTCERPGPITQIRCDSCGALHDIEGFEGIVIHFSEEDDEDDNVLEDIDEDDIIYEGEFHFCQARCITEYILAHPGDFFSPYDDRGAIMIVGPNDIAHFFYALGRCDYD